MQSYAYKISRNKKFIKSSIDIPVCALYMKNLFYKILSCISILKSKRKFDLKELEAVQHITFKDHYCSFGYSFTNKLIYYYCRSSFFLSQHEADTFTFMTEPTLRELHDRQIEKANDNKLKEILSNSAPSASAAGGLRERKI